MAQPLPAFQKRWMVVATIAWSPSLIRSVAAGLLWKTATTGVKASLPVRASWESTWSPIRIDSIARGPSRVWTGVPAPKQAWCSGAMTTGFSTNSV